MASSCSIVQHIFDIPLANMSKLDGESRCRLFPVQIFHLSVTASCWLSFYLLICIPNRECSQIREKEKKNSSLPYTLPSPHNRLPCLPTSPLPTPHLPFSHSDSYWNPSEPPPAHPTPPLSFVFSLPLIAKLARNAASRARENEQMKTIERERGAEGMERRR